MNKKLEQYVEYAATNGNIITTCKECSDIKYENFLKNNGVLNLVRAYEKSKSLFVKARFIDEGKVEHMWIEVKRLIEKDNITFVEGTLNNDPVLVSNISCGDTVRMSIYNICNFIADNEPFMDLL